MPKKHGNGNGNINSSKWINREKHLEKLLPKSLEIEKLTNGASSASNAGILYYKCILEEMRKKINELQQSIEQAESKMEIQKQNIKDMMYRKNSLLCNFHEIFRKFTRKTEYENKIEDEIEQLVKFLDGLMSINNEINYVKTSEISIRNYAIEKFQAICSELQPIIISYETDVEQMQSKLKELQTCKAEWEIHDKLMLDVCHAIDLHEREIDRFKWSIKTELANCDLLRNEGERIKLQVEGEILEKQRTIKNDVIKIQQDFHSIKNTFSELKHKQNEVIQMKEKLTKYNDMLSKNKQKITEIEMVISEKQFKQEKLQDEIEMNLNHLHMLEDKLTIQIEKQETLRKTLRQYEEKVKNEEILLSSLLQEEQSHGKIEEQLTIEIDSLKEKIASIQTQKMFSEEIVRKEMLKKNIDGLNQEKIMLKEDIFKLNSELNMKTKKIDQLKKDLLKKEILVEDDASNKSFLHSYLTIENEQNIVSGLIDVELDGLFEKLCEQQPLIQNLEKNLEECSAENLLLEQEIMKQEQILQDTLNSTKTCDNSIYTLKHNVYQGKYVTLQDVKKQITTLTNYVKNEQNAVDKLKEEIAEIRKKRPLLTPDKKQNFASARNVRSKKKIQEPQDANEKNNSSDSDIYSFK